MTETPPLRPEAPQPDKARCKWCSSSLTVLRGIWLCVICDSVRGEPQHGKAPS